MKKLLSLLLASMLLFVLAACGSESKSGEGGSTSEEPKANEEETNEVSSEVKTALLEYQGNVIKVIRNAESTFAGYATPEAIEAAEVTPADAAAAVAEEIAAISIPAELADYQADLETATEQISQFYAKKAELLAAGSTDLTEADSLKQSYVDAINKVFEEVDVTAPSFDMVFL